MKAKYLVFIFISIVSCTLDVNILSKKVQINDADAIPDQWMVHLHANTPQDLVADMSQWMEQMKLKISTWDPTDEVGHFIVLENTSEEAIHELLGKFNAIINFVEQDRIIDTMNYELQQDEKEEIEVFNDDSNQQIIEYVQFNVPSWGLDRIDQKTKSLDGKFYYKFTGKNVHVYDLGSGVTMDEDEFDDRLIYAFNGVTNEGESDYHGIGTWSSSSIASKSYGVAKKAKVYSVKVINRDKRAQMSVIVNGLKYVLKHYRSPAVVHMGITFDSTQPMPSIDNAIKDLEKKNILTIIAAGDDKRDGCLYSSIRLPYALAVGATDKKDRITSTSNNGRCVEIYAPGDDLRCLGRDNQATICEGSEVSSALVTGLAAMYLENEPKMKANQLKKKIVKAAIEMNDPKRGKFKLLYTNSGEPMKMKAMIVVVMVLMMLF